MSRILGHGREKALPPLAAVRVCAAYRSVSFDAATLLARLIPLELLAAERTRVYWRLLDEREMGVLNADVLEDIKKTERVITHRQ